VLQGCSVAVHCSARRAAASTGSSPFGRMCCGVLQCVAVCCRVAVLQGIVLLQEPLPAQLAALLAERVVVFWSVLQCVTVCGSAFGL